MSIGDKIRKARLDKGMSQEELGDILGIQKSAVAKYENGRVTNIKRQTLQKLSDVLDIPPHELIYEEELPDNVRQLVQFAKSVPEEKAEMVLRVMRSIVEGD